MKARDADLPYPVILPAQTCCGEPERSPSYFALPTERIEVDVNWCVEILTLTRPSIDNIR